MTSYCLYNFIVMNYADVSGFLSLVSRLKVLIKSLSKMYYLSVSVNGTESYAYFSLSIVTAFEIWTCDVTSNYKLSKNFIS